MYCVNSECFFLFPFLSLLTRNVRAEFPWWLAIDWADCSSKFQRWIKKAKQKKKKIPRITKKNGPFHNIKSRNFIWNHTIWIYIFWNASNFLSVEFDGKTLKKNETMAFYTSAYLSRLFFYKTLTDLSGQLSNRREDFLVGFFFHYGFLLLFFRFEHSIFFLLLPSNVNNI